MRLGESMTLSEYLRSRGLSEKVVDELLPYIPDDADNGVFIDPASIMNPDKWLYWAQQTRFVVVGAVPQW